MNIKRKNEQFFFFPISCFIATIDRTSFKYPYTEEKKTE